jgi:hypothetical protein
MTNEIVSASTILSPASSVAGAPPLQPPAYSQYPRPTYTAPVKTVNESGVLWGVVIRSGLGLLLFFLLHGIGLLVAGYGLVYAIKAQSEGNRYGVVCIAIAGVTCAIIGIGWIMRLNGAGV